MSLGSRDKRIAYSIVRHLQSQSAAGVLSQDGKEGIESKRNWMRGGLRLSYEAGTVL